MVDPVTIGAAVEAVKGMHKLTVQLIDTMDQRRTDRAAIVAQAVVMVEEIRLRKEALLSVIDRTYGERRAGFAMLEEQIRNAAVNHDVETLRYTVGTFLTYALDDPMSKIAEMDRQLREGTFSLKLTRRT